MVKELRSRMRGRRAFVVLTIYLGILALIAYGVYVVIVPSARAQGGFGAPVNASALVGQAIFILLSFFQLLLVLIVVEVVLEVIFISFVIVSLCCHCHCDYGCCEPKCHDCQTDSPRCAFRQSRKSNGPLEPGR